MTECVKRVVVLTGISMILSNCAQETLMEDNITQSSSPKQMYEEFSRMKTIPLSKVFGGRSTANRYEDSFLLEITDYELDSFNRISDERKIEIIDNLSERIENAKSAGILVPEIDEYGIAYDIMGGEEQVRLLCEFAENYLCTSGGWEKVESLKPKCSNIYQERISVLTAICIDKMMRPIYNYLKYKNYQEDSSLGIMSRGLAVCDRYLEERLAIAGVGIGAELFLDAIADGTITELEVGATELELIHIWMEYENCNGRFY